MPQMPGLLSTIRMIIKLYDASLKSVWVKHGLSPVETHIIGFLYHNPQLDTASDIVELRMLQKGNVSQAVESLIQKGLLTRRQDQADRRKIHLSLTPLTQPIVEDILQVRASFQERLFRGFTPEEQELFESLNQRLVKNITFESEREGTL